MTAEQNKGRIKLAESKLAEAEHLVEAAVTLLQSAGLEGRALDGLEAIDYIHGALGVGL